ncbi:MAG: hypothetical protein ACI8ZO_001175 [Flavobacteriales bacterium]|jgi:hypothetical protein
MSEFSQLLLVALAPVCVIAFWVYTKDKRQKEPLGQLGFKHMVGLSDQSRFRKKR